MMKHLKNIVFIVLALLVLSQPASAGQPKYVFYFIGDGLGASQRQFSEFFCGKNRQSVRHPFDELL